MKIYLIGSLRNPKIPAIANALEAAGHEVFADWFSPGPEADVFWQAYEITRGRDYFEAIDGPHAWNVFEFDEKWLNWAEAVVLVLPAGKSAHIEMGYARGAGKTVHVLFDQAPERWDVMYRFAHGIHLTIDQLLGKLN